MFFAELAPLSLNKWNCAVDGSVPVQDRVAYFKEDGSEIPPLAVRRQPELLLPLKLSDTTDGEKEELLPFRGHANLRILSGYANA